jgi:thiol-disulfide isomerase/thioredoxin
MRSHLAALTIAVAITACAHGRGAQAPRMGPAVGSLGFVSVGEVAFEPRRLAGQVVLVSFLATWCFPCLGLVPQLATLQRQHAAEGFQVLAVGMDLEGARVLQAFAEHYELPFPLLLATQAVRDGTSPFGEVKALPTTFLFGREGELLEAFAGGVAPQALERLVAQACRSGR